MCCIVAIRDVKAVLLRPYDDDSNFEGEPYRPANVLSNK